MTHREVHRRFQAVVARAMVRPLPQGPPEPPPRPGRVGDGREVTGLTLDMARHTFVLLLGVGLALGGMVGTAGAGGGWYLLIPPRSSFNEHEAFLRGFKILDSKPLSEWGQEGAYDSAAECEAAKSSHVGVEQRYYEKSAEAYRKDLGANTDPVALKLQRYFTENANATVDAYLASRCVRSDDPRLVGRR
jgi:hypothetical protein